MTYTYCCVLYFVSPGKIQNKGTVGQFGKKNNNPGFVWRPRGPWGLKPINTVGNWGRRKESDQVKNKSEHQPRENLTLSEIFTTLT